MFFFIFSTAANQTFVKFLETLASYSVFFPSEQNGLLLNLDLDSSSRVPENDQQFN